MPLASECMCTWTAPQNIVENKMDLVCMQARGAAQHSSNRSRGGSRHRWCSGTAARTCARRTTASRAATGEHVAASATVSTAAANTTDTDAGRGATRKALLVTSAENLGGCRIHSE